jgi:hypothetical protein
VSKIGYEWKNIYRIISKMDRKNIGIVTIKQFEQACAKANVKITKDDSQKISSIFGEPQSGDLVSINYTKMSHETGLH